MSGPVTVEDAPPSGPDEGAHPPCVELFEGRATTVGGLPVTRLLPKRARRTVGAWCFVDHFGPADVDAEMQVGPHPHIGLQTVTWVLDGEVLHRDSIGSEQLIRRGQVNLMSAGHGVAHAEASPGRTSPGLHGLQLWVAQPDATRGGAPTFQHVDAVPEAEVGTGAVATVLVGELAGARSPARADLPLLGAQLDVSGTVALPLDPTFEHAVVVVDGATTVDGAPVAPGVLAYLGVGRDELALGGPARLLLLGGPPLEEHLVMWWNFVARTADEVEEARRDWQQRTGRFGDVASSLAPIPAPERRLGG